MSGMHLPRWLLKSAVCAVTILLPALSFGEGGGGHEIHGSNELSVTYNDVSGAGSSQSSLTEGFRYLEVLNLFGNGRVNQFDYTWNLGVKGTDDRRNDMKTWSMTNLQARITDKVNTLTVGDTFESLSQYSLNTALKGASYKLQHENFFVPQLTALYGVAYSRWDNLWGVDATERQVFGGKIRQNISRDLWVGFSGIQTIDHMQDPSGELFDGQTYTVDWEYRPIPGLTVQGESAWAYSGVKGTDNSYTEYDGHAHKFVITGDGAPSRVTLEYERVSPDFKTVVGSATPDREKAKARWRYTITKDYTLTSAMLWYHDNLDGQKEYRTEHYKPELSLTVKKPFSRQYAQALMSYKIDRTYNKKTDTLDHFINLNYRDRFGVIDSDTNFGVIVYDSDGSSERESAEYTYNTILSSRHTVGDVIIKPSLYLGGWTYNDELTDRRDQIVEYSGGLGVDFPWLKVTSNLKVGENRLIKERNTDAAKTFGTLNVYWKPDYLANAGGMLYLKAFVNDYRYDPNNVSGSRDFRENSVTCSLNLQF